MDYTGKELLRIIEWDIHFENSTSRQRKRCFWCGIPNKMDGDTYIEITEMDKATDIYTAWISMVLIASKTPGDKDSPRSGLLIRSTGRPHSPRSLSSKSKFPERIYTNAIPILLRLGWIEIVEDYDIPADEEAGKGKGKAKGKAKKDTTELFETFVDKFNSIMNTKYAGDKKAQGHFNQQYPNCLLYTSPSPRD